MTRWIKILLGLLALGLFGFFFAFAPLFDRAVNRMTGEPLPAVSERATALHKKLSIADMHSDALMWNRDFLDQHSWGHVDLPRMKAGNAALQVLSSVTKTPRGQNYDENGGDTDNISILVAAQRQPLRTWGSLLQRSLYHAEKLDKAVVQSDGQLVKVTTAAELDRLLADRAAGKQVSGGLLSIEGMQNIEGKLENVDRLFAAGFRMGGLAHFFDNEVAGSVHGLDKYGLTPLGHQVVARMEASGMIVDVAHSSHATIADVLKIAKRPIVFSHGGVKGVCNNNRNLTDEEIRGIAKTGGVVGIGVWDAALCVPDLAHMVKSITYVRDLVGIDHVGLGTDWDGTVIALMDVSQTAALTQALIDAGYTDADIAKVMGGNVLRVLRQGIPS